jgi:hypothetical protein
MKGRWTRERMGSGGLRGLQILLSGVFDVRGGFDSHTFPPSLLPAGPSDGRAASRSGALRSAVGLGLLAVVLLVTAPSARADDRPSNPRLSSPADSAARAAKPRHDPFGVMVRSAVLPGWGQITNNQPIKAAVVIGGEAFLIGSALRELDRQQEAIQRSADAAALGDSAGMALADADATFHRDRKITWIWWGLVAHLLSMADAYVDAHLSTFEADFGRSRESRAPAIPDDPVVSLAIRVRF